MNAHLVDRLAQQINTARGNGEAHPSALARVVLTDLFTAGLAGKVGSESRLADYVYDCERVGRQPADLLAKAIVAEFDLDKEQDR